MSHLFLTDVHIPSGYVPKNSFASLYTNLKKKYGVSDLIMKISNDQVFLNQERITALKVNLEDVQKFVVNEIISYPYIKKAYTATTMQTRYFKEGAEKMLQNGYHQKLSGDVLFTLESGVISYDSKGTTHGSGYNYDTHVPLLFLWQQNTARKNLQTHQRDGHCSYNFGTFRNCFTKRSHRNCY